MGNKASSKSLQQFYSTLKQYGRVTNDADCFYHETKVAFCNILPIEICTHIFGYLNMVEWQYYTQVSKRFRSLLNEDLLWKEAFHRYFPSLQVPAERQTVNWKSIVLNDAVFGVCQFNKVSSQKGIDWFVNLHYVEQGEQIAQFLTQTNNLLPHRVAQYCGTRKGVQSIVARAFVELQGFANTPFLQAQARFLHFLRDTPSGKPIGHKIEDLRYLLRLFGDKYYHDNLYNEQVQWQAQDECKNDVARTMQLFIDKGIIQDTAQDKCVLLRSYPDFGVTQVGAYVVQQHLMTEFMDTFDFTNMFLGDALRLVFSTLRITGQNQLLKKALWKFSKKYWCNNPTLFVKSETPYVLAYSMIVLNTDKRSPHVKKKMSRVDFHKGLTAIDDKITTMYCDLLYDYVVNGYNLTA